jgi:hypothetical protein
MAYLVVNSNLIIESMVDEIERFSALFEFSLQLKTKNHTTFL